MKREIPVKHCVSVESRSVCWGMNGWVRKFQQWMEIPIRTYDYSNQGRWYEETSVLRNKHDTTVEMYIL